MTATAATASGEVAPPQPLPACTGTYDPYDYTSITINACGYATYPEIGTTALSGGGLSYNYYVDGTVARVLVPPAGFNPLTASAAQLDEYGFPARPADPAGLEAWQQEFSGYSGSAPPTRFLAQAGITADLAPQHWAGYQATAPRGRDFTHAATSYDEPSQQTPQWCPKSCCPLSTDTDSVVVWAGMSGTPASQTGDLVQNGTWVGNSSSVDPTNANMKSDQGWWAFYTQYPPGSHPRTKYAAKPVASISASPGKEFDASVRWIPDKGVYDFFFNNYATHQHQTVEEAPPSWFHSTRNHAEAVAELNTIPPGASGHNPDLIWFGTAANPLRFLWSKAALDYGPDRYFSHYSTSREYIRDSSTPPGDMASASSPIGPMGNFTAVVHHCHYYGNT